jgi:hypothetical protein
MEIPVQRPSPPRPRRWLPWLAGGALVLTALAVWLASSVDAPRGAPGGRPPAPERITLAIGEKSFAQLAEKRAEALRTGILRSEDADFVPAEVSAGGATFKAKLRLKGDWTDHLMGEQWSFRVELEDGALGGLRRFSLQLPARRSYVYEWLFHELLRREGLVALRYRFAPVTLRRMSGGRATVERDLGLYAVEEGFSKELIESSREREGVLAKIDENVLWDARNSLIGLGLPFDGYGDPQLTGADAHRVDVFTPGAVLGSPGLAAQFRTAKNLLQGYRDGVLDADQVFDAERLGAFMVVANLTGSLHGLAYHNLRFYYNPVTSRLEPVGFDGSSEGAITQATPWYLRRDTAYWTAFARAIERMAAPAAFAERMAGLDAPLAANAALLAAAYTDATYQPRVLEANRRVLWHAVHPPRAIQPFFVDGGAGFLELEVRTLTSFPVEIVGLSYLGKRDIAAPARAVIVSGGGRVPTPVRFELPESLKHLFTEKKKRKTGFDVKRDLPEMRVAYRIAGTSEVRYEPIVPWRERDPGFAAGDVLRTPPNVAAFPFLFVDEKHKTITFQSGDRTLAETLIIPPGYLVRAAEGLRLNLTQGAAIISFSPLAFTGTAERPVYIFSAAGDGQGLAVLRAGRRSVLDHVVFENLSNPETAGWSLTASVMFYESPVTIRDSVFLKNRCEDALNVMRADVQMSGGEFRDTQADAFDGDFVTGAVAGTRFTNPGNDGIDVSGSNLTVRDVVVRNPGDKGVSAGEGTTLRIANLTVIGGEIAVAAKDRSTVTLQGAAITGARLGFTAYQKKPEYGPAFIYASGVSAANVPTLHLVAAGSVLELEGRRVPASREVKARMYGVEFGKASR